MIFASLGFSLLFLSLPAFFAPCFLSPARRGIMSSCPSPGASARLGAWTSWRSWGAPLFGLRCAMPMERAAERTRTRRLVLGPVGEFGAHGSFKRANFGVRTFNGVARGWGSAPMPWFEIIRPVGLGFSVLQHVSCGTDAWRPRCRPVAISAPMRSTRPSSARASPARSRAPPRWDMAWNTASTRSRVSASACAKAFFGDATWRERPPRLIVREFPGRMVHQPISPQESTFLERWRRGRAARSASHWGFNRDSSFGNPMGRDGLGWRAGRFLLNVKFLSQRSVKGFLLINIVLKTQKNANKPWRTHA